MTSRADEEPTNRPVAGRSRVLAACGGIARWYGRFVRLVLTIVTGSALLVLAVLFLNYFVIATPKDHAYRNVDPASPGCQDGLKRGWSIIADTGRRHLPADAGARDDGGWMDPSDDEIDVVASDRRWSETLRCSLQRHVVPALDPHLAPLDYHLGFLEFQEDGQPYPLVFSEAGVEKRIDSAMLQHGMESAMHARHVPASMVRPVITQLDVLKQHLSVGSHFVIVFVHGWRHDARIGDRNVADLRLFAAHAVRFLRQRCSTEPAYCGMDVTAVYVGWRGARVDELGLKEIFGTGLGGAVGGLSAGATLFDRKPVSEQVAPGAVSAIRTLQAALARSPEAGGTRNNKMIVFGHSLGGNMLATGLHDDLLKAVRQHVPNTVLAPPLGDLVILLNPAAEATKWTDIQREVWTRTASEADGKPMAMMGLGDRSLFAAGQKPVLVSITAALAFPPGGLRKGDCEWLGLTIDDGFGPARKAIRDRLARTDSMFDSGVDYDWATHDLFPTFKLDLRPAGAFLDHLAAHIEHRQPKGQSCASFPEPGPIAALESLPARMLASLASTFPFQNSAPESSHTIGNLDPPRPAAGLLSDHLASAAPFGTTHEMIGLTKSGSERHQPYATLADADLDCPIANGWLRRALMAQQASGGLYWDSEMLAAPRSGGRDGGGPAARFVHGFDLSGLAPITQANDPFWNVRAFDNALSRHDGYRLSSFICAVDQLVLDDSVGATDGEAK